MRNSGTEGKVDTSSSGLVASRSRVFQRQNRAVEKLTCQLDCSVVRRRVRKRPTKLIPAKKNSSEAGPSWPNGQRSNQKITTHVTAWDEWRSSRFSRRLTDNSSY